MARTGKETPSVASDLSTYSLCLSCRFAQEDELLVSVRVFKRFFFLFQEHPRASKPSAPVRGGPQGALQSSSSETTSLMACKSSSVPCWSGARSVFPPQSPCCLRVVSTPPRCFCLPRQPTSPDTKTHSPPPSLGVIPQTLALMLA